MTFRARIIQIAEHGLTGDDTYIESQSEGAITAADQLENLRSNLDDLFDDTRGGSFIALFEQLYAALTAEGADFALAFPNAKNFRLFLLLANYLNQIQLDEPLPADLFGMSLHEELTFDHAYTPDGSELRIFGYHAVDTPTDSMVLLDLRSPLPEHLINQSNLTKRLAAIACILIGGSAIELNAAPYVISSGADEQQRSEHLKYQLLLHGMVLTWPYASPPYPSLASISDSLTFADNYIQFKEPFDILSEVNSRRNILDAYLSSYHVLENYMIRAQIATVERKSNHSAMFGIRSFKSLGNAVGNKEYDHLNSLLTKCWAKSIGGSTVSAFAEAQIIALAGDGDFDPAEFRDLLGQLEMTAPPNSLVAQAAAFRPMLPRLLYAIRCAIVHNKETEFHISNRELRSATVRVVLTKLCIPFMQRVGFGLPSVMTDNPIRYSRQSIDLY